MSVDTLCRPVLPRPSGSGASPVGGWWNDSTRDFWRPRQYRVGRGNSELWEDRPNRTTHAKTWCIPSFPPRRNRDPHTQRTPGPTVPPLVTSGRRGPRPPSARRPRSQARGRLSRWSRRSTRRPSTRAGRSCRGTCRWTRSVGSGTPGSLRSGRPWGGRPGSPSTASPGSTHGRPRSAPSPSRPLDPNPLPPPMWTQCGGDGGGGRRGHVTVHTPRVTPLVPVGDEPPTLRHTGVVVRTSPLLDVPGRDTGRHLAEADPWPLRT